MAPRYRVTRSPPVCLVHELRARAAIAGQQASTDELKALCRQVRYLQRPSDALGQPLHEMFLLGGRDLYRVTHFRGVDGMRHRGLTGELLAGPARFRRQQHRHSVRTDCHCPCDNQPAPNTSTTLAAMPPQRHHWRRALARISQPLRRWPAGLAEQARSSRSRVQGAQGIALLAKGGAAWHAARGVVHQARLQPDPLVRPTGVRRAGHATRRRSPGGRESCGSMARSCEVISIGAARVRCRRRRRSPRSAAGAVHELAQAAARSATVCDMTVPTGWTAPGRPLRRTGLPASPAAAPRVDRQAGASRQRCRSSASSSPESGARSSPATSSGSTRMPAETRRLALRA